MASKSFLGEGSYINHLPCFVGECYDFWKIRIKIFIESHDLDNSSYQSWKSRLSERFSPKRERITWEGKILGYTGGFSPKRELSRLGEKWQFGAVDTMRFSLERESLA
ncbi:hypothetical protein Lal_00039357 [Lupinus albus]|nr:hypothetical protein Lal_00039357 [Lupinus albus]